MGMQDPQLQRPKMLFPFLEKLQNYQKMNDHLKNLEMVDFLEKKVSFRNLVMIHRTHCQKTQENQQLQLQYFFKIFSNF